MIIPYEWIMFLDLVNHFLTPITAIILFTLTVDGMGNLNLASRIGYTVITSGMIWLAFVHKAGAIIDCGACLSVLYGIHILAVGSLYEYLKKYPTLSRYLRTMVR